MKLVIIGGGSTYTSELFQELIKSHNNFPVSEVVLNDIDENRLDTVGRFCGIMLEKSGKPFTLTTSLDALVSIKDADFVIFQLRVGGQEARNQDIKLGTDLGIIGQETTGIGGFSKAMRTIPVILNYCEIIEHHAKPSCKVINFTNPSSIVTQAISDYTKLNVIGLCNVPIIMQRQSAELLKADFSDLYYDYVGLNHLGWLRGVYKNGKNKIKTLVEALAENPELFRAANHSAIDSSLIRSLGMIPSPYLQYFYYTEQMLEKISTAEKSRAEIVMELDNIILAHFSSSKTGELPEEMKGRGGELYSYAAVKVMSSIWNNAQDIQIVNTINGTTIPSLEPDDIIEVPAVVHQNGTTPISIGAVEHSILGLIQQVKAYERLTVVSAVNKNYNDALFALFNNPLTKDLAHAKVCLQMFMERNNTELTKGFYNA